MRSCTMSNFVAFMSLGCVVHGCTNILVSRGASEDGSTMISYNADAGNFYGSVGHYPAAEHDAGSLREIWDWDSSIYLGSIPEVQHTYNVIGNANEHGLIIGETTFGGLEELGGSGNGVMAYGPLIWVTLQRAKTAREAIATMDALCQEHGYASEGESFSIADGDEVWLMELIGKGAYEKGAVWVARRVPEGYIGSTANQARIQTFPLDDPENCLYSADVVSFAQAHGLYPKDGRPEDFSFSDTYDPLTFSGARQAEARVWHIFQPASGGAFSEYLDYVQGRNLTNRMPLFAKVAKKLHVNDTMNLMRTTFDGTYFDNTGTLRPDVGAGSGASPYRWRPLGWESGGKRYFNERTVGVQQTAWTFVAQSRKWLPAPIRALFWFAPDDSKTAVRIPLYGGAVRVPPSFGDRAGQDPAAATDYGVEADAYTMSMDSAFWVWNLVANLVYGERYFDTMPLVQQKIHFYQDRFFQMTAAMDEKAAALLEKDPSSSEAIQLITDFGVDTGEQMTKDWRNFWMHLFSRVRDGFTVTKPQLPQCVGSQREGCTARPMPRASATGYSDSWYARIVADGDNAEHFAWPESAEHDTAELRKSLRMDKDGKDREFSERAFV